MGNENGKISTENPGDDVLLFPIVKLNELEPSEENSIIKLFN